MFLEIRVEVLQSEGSTLGISNLEVVIVFQNMQESHLKVQKPNQAR